MDATEHQAHRAFVAIGEAFVPSLCGEDTMKAEVLRRTVVIRNPQGFHVRPAAALAQAARRFEADATVINGDVRACAREAMELLMLCAEPGHELLLEVAGADAAEALEVLAAILGAEEVTPMTPPPPPKKG
jgi:phosphotransferase system HPr (HPr) family protein